VRTIGRDGGDHRNLVVVLLRERHTRDLRRVGAAIGEHQQPRFDLASRAEREAGAIGSSVIAVHAAPKLTAAPSASMSVASSAA
jgi:hypothetical protein